MPSDFCLMPDIVKIFRKKFEVPDYIIFFQERNAFYFIAAVTVMPECFNPIMC